MTEQEKLITNLQQEYLEVKNKKHDYISDMWIQFQKMGRELSEGIYSDDNHFIYELIQNAEDTKSNEKNHVLEFILEDNGLTVFNNEIGFNEEQIKAICSFGNSTKSKDKNSGFIGEKGIGFKSVFKITDFPAISSNGYRFKFRRFNEDNETEYVIPHWINDTELKQYSDKFRNNTHTTLYLPFSQDKKEASLKKLKYDIRNIEPSLLLFLNQLNNIKIIQNGKTQLNTLKKEIKDEDLLQCIIKNGELEEKYYLFKKQISVKDTLDEVINKNGRRKDVKEREIVLAFPNAKNEKTDDRIFAFLPTKLHSGLKYIIQADFILQSGRENIATDSEWNKWQFDEIEKFICDDVLLQLKNHSKLKMIYLNYFLKSSDSYNPLIEELFKNILNNFSKKELVLTSNDNWQMPKDIILLEEIEIESKYLKILFGNNYELKHKDFILDDFFVNRFNIKKLNRKEIINKICGYFDSKDFNILNNEEILYFTRFLTKYLSVDSRANSYDKDSFEKVKKSLPILPKYQSKKKYYLHDSIYISSEYKPDLIIENFVDESEFDFDKYNFLSNDYLDKDNKSLENFIRKIISEQKEDKNRKTIEFFEKNTMILQKYLLHNLENNYKKILDFLIENQENNIERISLILLIYSNNGTWLNRKNLIYFSSDDNTIETLNHKLFSLIKDNLTYKDFFIKIFNIKEADIITRIINEYIPWLSNNINKRNDDNDDHLLKITKDIIINFDKFEKEDIDKIKTTLYFISINQKNKYLKANNIYLTQLISEEIYSSNSIDKYLQNRELFDFLDAKYEEIFEEIKDKKILEIFFKKFNFEKNLKEEDINKFIKSINNELDLNSSVEALRLVCNSIDQEDKKKIEEIKNLEIFSNDNYKIKISSLFFEKVADLNISFIHNKYKKIKNLNILRQYFASENDIKPFIEYLKKIDSFDEVIKIYNYLNNKSSETTLREHDKNHTITTDKIRNFFMNEKLIYDKNLTTYSIEDIVWKEEKNKDILVLSEIYPSELENFFLKKIKISQEKNIKQIIDGIKSIKSKRKDYFELLIDLGNLITENTELDKYQKSYNGSIDNRFDKNIYENAKQFILKEERIFILENDERCKDDNFYFNDLNVDEIPEKLESRIFSIDNKTFSINHFNKLIDTLKITRLSQLDKKYSNREFKKEFSLKEYRKILHFSYDLLYTKNLDEYNNLKARKKELEKINLVEKISIHRDIICQIDINNEILEVNESKYHFVNNILYITKENDIFKIISNEIGIIKDKEIKDFYNDVIKGDKKEKDYYKNEEIKEKSDFSLEIPEYIESKINEDIEYSSNYEKEEEIIDSNSDNKFCEINSKTVEQEREERRKSGLEQIESHNNETKKLKNSLEENQGSGETPAFIQAKNNETIILDEKKHEENISNDNKNTKREFKTRTYTNNKIQDEENLGNIEEFLYKEYEGHCQICGDTFADGNKNCFELKSLNIRKNRDVNRKGNTLSLCHKHHAIFNRNLQKNIFIEKLDKDKNININTIKENFEFYDFVGLEDVKKENDAFYRLNEKDEFIRDVYFLPIKLFNKVEYIKFTEAHIWEFIVVWNEN